MPYKKKTELPDRVKENLPDHAEEIYVKTFNSAWDQYQDPSKRKKGGSREEVSHRVAWSAVKKEYKKNPSTGEWIKK